MVASSLGVLPNFVQMLCKNCVAEVARFFKGAEEKGILRGVIRSKRTPYRPALPRVIDDTPNPLFARLRVG